jgi:transcription termination factor Rho
MTVEEFSAEREMLGSRDREELHEIASAMGVRGATRLRKADLIEAILAAATGGGDGAIPEPAERPKRRPVKRKAGEDGDAEDSSGEAAAAEADAGTAVKDVDAEPRPQEDAARDAAPDATPEPAATSADPTVAVPEAAAGGEAAAETAETTKSEPEQASSAKAEPRPQRPTDAPGGGRSGEGGPGRREGSPGGQRTFEEGERQPFGEGRGRRRRRRGRDRQAGPFEGGAEVRHFEPQGEPVEVEGLLEIRDEGYGFMRTGGYLAGRGDVYVSASQVRRFGLRKGDYLKGATRPAASNEKYPALLRLDEINGVPTEEARSRPRFEDRTPLFPDERLRLEIAGDPNNITGRIIDLISPIGKGQRGLIVSPPKAGKTTIMKQIVHSVERNNPEVHLIVLLVDERPEEVTDMRRHVQRGEVVASTFDRPSEEHTQVAELTIERAKRLVELGKDVVIMLDGITRLARAYNLAAPASGRILSGGVDSAALYPPKKFFGAARNIEEGGSLTILATALIETGSRMDEVIFEEFKGTGNMELRLDRKLAERRIYPALDVEASSTRHEELLFDRTQLQQVWKLRRVLNALEGGAGLELLMDKIKTTRGNDEFLAEIAKAPTAG